MTISSVTSKVIYVGTGSTASAAKIFAYPFKINLAADLTVSEYINATSAATVKALDTDYVVSGEGSDSGGNVTLTGSYTSLSTGSQLIIQRVVDLTQAVNYVENDPFSAETHEGALDKLCMSDQQLQEQIDRCIKADIAQTSSSVDYVDFVAQRVAAESSATVAVAQAVAAVVSASSASSSASSASGSASAAASSATVCVTITGVSTSSATVAVAQASNAVVSATAAASSGVVCVSASAGAVTQATVATSSATVAVDQSAIAVSSATVSVTQASNAYVYSTQASTSSVSAASSAAVAVAQAATNYRYLRVTLIDPNSLYSLSPSVCLLQSLNAAITVNDIEVTCNANPGTQLSGNIMYADAFIGTANPVIINDFNTTSGVRYDATLISSSVVAGKCIYLAFDAQPTASITQVNFNIKYTYV